MARFEITGTLDGSMNPSEGAAPTDEDPGAQLLTPGSNYTHRPLHHTSSVPQFGIEERRIHRLQLEEFDGRRSRSHSEPLTREAVKIAQELRRASDLFCTIYEVSSPTVKREFQSSRRGSSRRVTVGGAGGESLRNELHQMLAERGLNPLPLEGTPV